MSAARSATLMRHAKLHWWLMCCLIAGPLAGHAAPTAASEIASKGADFSQRGLRNDPFRRPHIGPGPAPVERPLPRSTDEATGPIEPVPWQPQLRGVMQAGAASVANVDGTVIGIGQTVDGWRLLSVDDGRAVFVQGRRQTILTMNNAGSPKK